MYRVIGTAPRTAIWIVVAVAVAGLAVWLVSVALAARKPHQEHAWRASAPRSRSAARASYVSGAGVAVTGGKPIL